MRLLLDTNAFLWWRDASPRLSARATDAIGDPDNHIVVSIVSLWEITIKRAFGSLQFLQDFEHVMAEEDFHLLPVGYSHLRSLGGLPLHHGDPFDRMIVAQGQLEDMPIVTGDPLIGLYDVETIW